LTRSADLQRFYKLLDQLAQRNGGTRTLAESHGRMDWPERGVYFFYEKGERRSDTGEGPRVTRVGTHALKAGSKTKLWTRLAQHRGSAKSGGGSHRGSIFRLLVGASLGAQDPDMGLPASWSIGSSAKRPVREAEHAAEVTVSQVIGAMPFAWLDIGDSPGPESQRGVVERGSIALLSNFGKQSLDSPSPNWLGHHCPRDRVVSSGLWNQNHVEEDYDPGFLEVLERLVKG
jgi:hypothetical protein